MIATQILSKLYPKPSNNETSGQIIKDELLGPKPSMIARFGSTEINAILFPKWPPILNKLIENKVLNGMEILSGFFPSNKKTIKKFSDLMFEDMKQLDILGSWRFEEMFLHANFRNAIRIQLKMLEPYLSNTPWTEALENKKVLVVHPFNQTIESQYHTNRERLFADQRILPKFESLQTIKAVQTIAGNQSEFPDWFAALDYMKSCIDRIDYDIAILGCGAYGFPLAAHIKRMGKKSVHLGGATQILFGIKGLRWNSHPVISSLYNQYWVKPSLDEIPQNSTKVDGGSYW